MTFLAAAALFIATNAPAAELVQKCRALIPADAELSGRVILRNRRGQVRAEYGYELKRSAGATDLKLLDADGQAVAFEKDGRLLGTDVTWSDLTLDYLWWDDYALDANCDAEESVHGQKCAILRLRRGEREVRVWIDRKTGALMQAEELAHGECVRRLWGTRIKKFGDRWMANQLEVETLGSGHRTKITVEELK